MWDKKSEILVSGKQHGKIELSTIQFPTISNASAHQKLLSTAVEDGVVEHLELAELANELDVAKHLSLGHKSCLLLVIAEVSGSLLVSCGNSCAILKLIFAFAKQQSFKGGNLRFWWFKVGSILVEPLAQLCIHGTVFGFIESFFKDLRKRLLEFSRI